MLASSSAWVGLVLSVLAAGPEPKSLIAQLGSPRFAEREAASEALERLGQDAFPILREARRDRDPEVKSRAEVLLEAIERTMLTRPTSITFTAGSQSMSRLVEEISRAEGVPILIGDGDATRMIEMKPVTLPFWQALDLLDVVPKWEADGEPDRFGNRRESSFRLIARQGPLATSSDSGPFRITIARPPAFAADLQGMEGFRAIGAGRPAAQDVLIPLDILAEPRLGIRVTGPIKIHDAVDDLNKTWNPSPRNIDFEVNNFGFATDSLGPKHSMIVRLRAPLGRGKTLTMLRGAIPVEVESRRIEPIIIPIGGTGQADRKPLAAEGFTLVVNGIVAQRQFGLGNTLSLEVTLRPEGWIGPMGRGGGRRNAGWGEQLDPQEEKFLRRLEVVDAEGRRFRTEPKPGGGGADGKHFLIDLTPPRNGVNSQPTEVHYYGQGRTPFEIPFQFKDVNLP